jgi:WD40 repeat protein
MSKSNVLVQRVDTFSGHRGSVYTLAAADSPESFFSAGGDGLIVQWNLNKPDWGQVVAQIPSTVYAMCYEATKKQLWIGQNFEGIQVIDPHQKQIVASATITKTAIFDIKIIENQAFIALSDGVIVVMDVLSFAVRKHLKASSQSARCIAISTAHRQVAVGYSDYQIRVFDLDSLDLIQTLSGHTNSVFTVTYSPDGLYLISGSRDAHLKVWNIDQGYGLQKDIAAHLYAINHIVFSADGQYFTTASMDKSIKLWSATDFKLLKVIDKARHAGHATSVNKLLWTAHQNRLVSCSDDRMVSVWELMVS